MGHRRWLEQEDPWRKDKKKFDNTIETRVAPRKQGGKKINEMLKIGKSAQRRGRCRRRKSH
jgi:hypothetical protein